MTKTRTAKEIHDGWKHIYQPIVSTIGNAANLLGMDVVELARRVRAAGLQPWGSHASGAPVFRWPALVALARDGRRRVRERS